MKSKSGIGRPLSLGITLALALLFVGAAPAFGAGRQAHRQQAAVDTLGGVSSVVGGVNNSCAIVSGGAVDCWGLGTHGALGDGRFHRTTPFGSAVPLPVVGVGGAGTLTGVTSLATDGLGFCALLDNGGVDCWGVDYAGELGSGSDDTAARRSAVPVRVVGVGGTGRLTGVTRLIGSVAFSDSYCALLGTGAVDCWGAGYDGRLGNGLRHDSAVPVRVAAVDRSGILTGVIAVTSGFGGYCALLNNGGVDCWGRGNEGELGDGKRYADDYHDSPIPVRVVGVGRDGILSDVRSVATDGNGFCALLKNGGVDCWGVGSYGQLGDGKQHSDGYGGSPVPVEVVGVGRVGTLAGVSSLVGRYINGGYCAVLSSGGVDCWGAGKDGQLGDGKQYSDGYGGSPVPVEVVGVGRVGTLAGVVSVRAGPHGYCALLRAGGLDCWGASGFGQLGNGKYDARRTVRSHVPVQVRGVAGNGSLGDVASVTDSEESYCALLSTGGVDCWGAGNYGELGNGQFYQMNIDVVAALPVEVLSPAA